MGMKPRNKSNGSNGKSNEPKYEPFTYKGKNIKTEAGLLNLLHGIRTKKEAEELLEAYTKTSSRAASNVGHVIGYLKDGEKNRLYDLFGIECVHPEYGAPV